MLEFIAQYWLEFVLGIVAAGLIGLTKYFWGLFKKHIKETLTNEISAMTNTIQKSMEENDKKLGLQINKLDKKITDLEQKATQTATIEKGLDDRLDKLEEGLTILKDGVLSIQKQQFMDECKALINQESPIEFEQYEKITKEHQVYNALGGNHDGDELYKLVFNKYSGQLEHTQK